MTISAQAQREPDVALRFPPRYAPARMLMMYLTEDCNLRCSYCFVDKKPRHMTVETAKKTIDFYLDRRVSGALYTIHLIFFGGEPFTRLDCMEAAVAYARQPRPNVYKTIEFSATTNGTLAGPGVERIIRDSAMSILLSMDGGASASMYRPFASGRPSHEVVARNLPRLAAWAPYLSVRMSFHPQSLDLLGNIRRILELGAPSVTLCPVLEADWEAAKERLEEAYDAVADEYVAQACRGRILPLEITNGLLRDYHSAMGGAPRPPRPCRVGSSLIGVDPDGNVLPCHSYIDLAQKGLGHVDRPGMDDARWRYVHLSSSDIPGCDDCFARPVCGGGCRASTLRVGLGLYDLHPGHCITMRAHVRALKRIYETLTAERNETFIQMLVSDVGPNPVLTGLATR